MSDIEIARQASKLPIQEIGAKLDIPSDHLLPFGHDKAKVSAEFIESLQDNPDGHLILVTAINPTPAGEGKTTTTVGLGDGLNRIGKTRDIAAMQSTSDLLQQSRAERRRTSKRTSITPSSPTLPTT